MTERQRAEIPRASGVYQILCRPTGKVYVGSAVDLYERWRDHRRYLRQGSHHNFYLQQAWDEYGEENFEFLVIEFLDEGKIIEREQYWIDQTGCVDKSFGFNICETAGYPGPINSQTWEGFIDPDGNEVVITNLAEFCRQHGLNVVSMQSLARPTHKLKAYKGWTHRNSVRQRDYIKTHEGFIAPDGSEVGPITNLAAFCREHRLDKTHMVAVAHGRILSHRGWTHKNTRQRLNIPKTYTGFINPQGERMVITNLRQFCLVNGLSIVHMYNLISGVRNIHKGWTWRPEGEDDDQASS